MAHAGCGEVGRPPPSAVAHRQLRRGPETCAERGARCAAVGKPAPSAVRAARQSGDLRRARGVAANSAAKRRHLIAPGVSPRKTSPSEWPSAAGATLGAHRMHAGCGEVGRPPPSAVALANCGEVGRPALSAVRCGEVRRPAPSAVRVARQSGDLRRARCVLHGGRDTPPPSGRSRHQFSRQAATYNSPGRQPGGNVAKRVAKPRRGDTRRSSNARRLRRGRETCAERGVLRRGRETSAERGALRRGYYLGVLASCTSRPSGSSK